MRAEERGGPLRGIRVVDFTHQAAGPWCTTLLGEMGAEVWKVEKPGRGDAIRHAGGADPRLGSFNFWGLNRNKKSVGIDLKHPQGRELAAEMAGAADVVVENFRPGVMASLGLDHDTLARRNPRLVYASITAFGHEGPMARAPAMDLIVQALSGLMGLTGEPGGPPVKPAAPLADLVSGTYAAYGIALALFERERTGRGQRVDVTMLEATLSMMADITTTFLNTGRRFERFGSGHPDLVPYQAFEASDGWFVVACLTQAFCRRLMRALGREEVLDDPRFATNAARCRHRAEFLAILEPIFRRRPRDAWLALLAEHDVPACRVNELEEVFRLDPIARLGTVVEGVHPVAGRFRTTAPVVRMERTPAALRGHPPMLGEHTDEVLRALGKSAGEIAALRDAGACG